MKQAYLETSALSRAADESMSGRQLRHILAAHGFVPVIGFHTIYELAKTFLERGKNDVARALFRIVADLEADYCEESYEVLCQELNHYFLKEPIKPFLDGEKLLSTGSEIAKLAHGVLEDRARSFIESRERRFRVDRSRIALHNIQLFAENPPTSRIRNFEEFTAYFTNGQLV